MTIPKIDYGKWFIGFNLGGYYFYPFNWLPNEPNLRYLGYHVDWYDGPLPSFGCWFFNISWGID